MINSSNNKFYNLKIINLFNDLYLIIITFTYKITKYNNILYIKYGSLL